MGHVRTKPAKSSQTTAKLWGKLSDLCRKTRYWLYTRKDKGKALAYADRLEEVLRTLPSSDLAIVRAEALALVSELRGRIDAAIRHRKHEIDLMTRLREEARSPRYDPSTRSYMLRGRNVRDLRDRREILQTLQNGKTHAGGQQPYATSRRA